MTHRQRHSQFARSLIGSYGEEVMLERFAGTTKEGGYTAREYHDPERIRVALRPGGIDVPFTTTEGAHGTADLWCVASEATQLEAKDRLTRLREFGEGGFGRGHFARGDTFVVSMPKYDAIHNVAVYQLDEADARTD